MWEVLAGIAGLVMIAAFVGVVVGLVIGIARKSWKMLTWSSIALGVALVLGILGAGMEGAFSEDEESAVSVPEQSATATPRPTATSRPPTPTPIPPRGLGISRQSIQSIFEGDAFGYVFGNAQVSGDGRESIQGQSPIRTNGSVVLMELIGPADNISKANMLFSYGGQFGIENIVDMFIFVGLFFPEWSGANEWVTENVQLAVGSDEGRTISRDGKTIKISWLKWSDDVVMLIVSVTAGE